MPTPFRSPRHLFVLIGCLALLLFGLWRAVVYETIQGDHGAGYMLGIRLSPWMLIGWVVGVLVLFFVWRRRA